MESTGVYWIPLFQILEERKIEACLVNAQHLKNVPGRKKTDVEDCQWIQHLHSVGLLRGSFRPDQEICAIRSLWRHRDNLIQLATIHFQHMQEALDQMNLQIHHVISDLAGTTGLAIVDAILPGERDLAKLAQLRDWCIRASEETIIKSLVGDYREEHLFTLRQSLQSYRHYQHLIQEVDGQVKQMMRRLPGRVDIGENHFPQRRTLARHLGEMSLPNCVKTSTELSESTLPRFPASIRSLHKCSSLKSALIFHAFQRQLHFALGSGYVQNRKSAAGRYFRQKLVPPKIGQPWL